MPINETNIVNKDSPIDIVLISLQENVKNIVEIWNQELLMREGQMQDIGFHSQGSPFISWLV